MANLLSLLDIPRALLDTDPIGYRALSRLVGEVFTCAALMPSPEIDPQIFTPSFPVAFPITGGVDILVNRLVTNGVSGSVLG